METTVGVEERLGAEPIEGRWKVGTGSTGSGVLSAAVHTGSRGGWFWNGGEVGRRGEYVNRHTLSTAGKKKVVGAKL